MTAAVSTRWSELCVSLGGCLGQAADFLGAPGRSPEAPRFLPSSSAQHAAAGVAEPLRQRLAGALPRPVSQTPRLAP